jgi:ribosome maturation factor RimP
MTEMNPTIVETVTAVLAARGLELYDLEVTGAGRARVVRVLVTAPAGVDLDTIAAATEAVSPALDDPAVARALPEPYALEVSSPGLERPLRTAAHYRAAIGETVSVKFHDAPRLRGTLIEVDEDGFTVATATDEEPAGGAQHVAFDDVVQARTVFEWGGSAPKPRRGKATKEVARR